MTLPATDFPKVRTHSPGAVRSLDPWSRSRRGRPLIRSSWVFGWPTPHTNARGFAHGGLIASSDRQGHGAQLRLQNARRPFAGDLQLSIDSSAAPNRQLAPVEDSSVIKTRQHDPALHRVCDRPRRRDRACHATFRVVAEEGVLVAHPASTVMPRESGHPVRRYLSWIETPAFY